MIDPLVKPELWNIQEAIIAYNASRLGLPMPVGLWILWERGGGKVYDLSGNGNDGDIVGADWVPQGLDFNGTSDYIDLGNPSTLNFGTSDFSIFAGIICSDLLGSTYRQIVNKEGVDPRYYFRVQDDAQGQGVLHVMIDDGVTSVSNFGVTHVDDNTLHHVGVTFDRSGFSRLYIDGLPEGSPVNISAVGDIDNNNNFLIGKRHDNTDYFKEILEYIYVFPAVLIPSQVATLSADPYGLVQMPRRMWAVEAAVGDYTLIAGGGSYGITGQATGLLAGRKLSIGSGTFSVTGTIAGLLRGYPLTADSGVYNIAGQEVSILKDSLIPIGSGSYDITGQDAALLRGLLIGIESGTYGLTGSDVTLIYTPIGAYTLIADSGTYNLTGSALDLFRGYHLGIEAAAYALSGQNTNLLKGFVIGLEAGGYDLSGQDVELIYSGEALTIGCMTVTFDSKQPLITFDSKQPLITFQDRCDNN